ncbi:hypothetical protein BZA05DRAFT_204555 [Tricharina praecox]|uniref:uncharacterized protein n=1 Tax=Tricharina praecox TaxID=43433 RepID=UPI00221E55F4|nr:uncharacterized protein BZA05DRAFT_204555 [Tricharina praecox]KAI5856586.1 hypothetical protein BZA05DRAFT_204555 [Tricharina praecox]
MVNGSAGAGDRVAEEPKGSKLVVGLDFGTTYTSVVFAHSESRQDIKFVQTWPGASVGANSANQVPTEIEYTPEGIRWGYEVSRSRPTPGSGPLKWFKLLLQQECHDGGAGSGSKARRSTHRGKHEGSRWDTRGSGAKRSTTVDEALKRLSVSSSAEPTRPPSQIATASCATSVDSAREILKGLDIRIVTVDLQSKVEWVLTVPAIWSDSAKDLMIQAARKAGFGERGMDFELISEPECGATYALNVIQSNNLSLGDAFVLCDAGGGTVITGNNPLQVDEVVAGTGALCGSTFLDKNFEDYMRRILGDETFDAMMPRSRAAMMRSWEETVKFKFGNEAPFSNYDINVPGVADNEELKIGEGWHNMQYEDVLSIFDPVIDQIVALVSQQVKDVRAKEERVKGILLVGGFGSSGYLLKRLEGHTYRGKRISVLQPVNAQTAIARGALLRGFDGSIVMARRATRHYGSSYNSRNCSLPEALGHIYRCPYEDVLKVSDKMHWYIVKGTAIGQSHRTFRRHVRAPPGEEPDFKFESHLYACDLDDAPVYKWQKRPAVYRVGELISDLGSVPRRKFVKSSCTNGDTLYRVEFKHRMTLVNEVWKFELIFDGQCYGAVNIQYT